MSTPFSLISTKINQISPLEHNFTEVLNAIALKPKILYFYGKLPQNVSKNTPQNGQSQRPKTVAIVGTRHNTHYGQEIAHRLAYELARYNVVIVSGLAYGVDSIAHQGCLEAGGTTVAVLGTRINHIYPAAHRPLAQKILASGGAIISEYAPDFPDYNLAPLAPSEAGWDGERWISYEQQNSDESPATQLFSKRNIDRRLSFLARNRLISGLSDIVVVVEAAERSGSLNTATHAIEQGKTVFAVPGNITSPYSQGCNKLIRQGAIPYTEPDDVLRELFPEKYCKKQRQFHQSKLFGDTDVETKILQAIASGCRSGEEIMMSTHLPPEVFSQTVTILEIKSRIHSLGLNCWALL